MFWFIASISLLAQILPLRGCLQSEGSSLFGIILADFRLQTWGAIYTVDIAPHDLNRKSAQKNPKIDRTSLCRHPLSEEEGIRRVEAHLLIEDPESALVEAENLADLYPDSLKVNKTLIEAFAANGYEQQSLDLWNQLTVTHPDLLYDRHLLEELSWGVLKKGIASSQYGVRLAGMVGAFLTRDVRALPILLKMMRDGNAVIRAIAIQMGCSYRDAPLKDEITRMMSEEKVWLVRLELIKAIGILRMKEFTDSLTSLVQSEKTTFEERLIAISSLLEMYDEVSYAEFQVLAKSSRAGLRHLACSIATHFQIKEAKQDMIELMGDAHPAVRIAAINAFGLCYREEMGITEAHKVLEPLLDDSHSSVAITAAWALLLIDPKGGSKAMGKWLEDPLPENRRLASAALAAVGSRGEDLSLQTLKNNPDPYVRANVAMGLLGQRVEIQKCSDVIFSFLQSEKKMWMWDSKPNPLFKILVPSQVRYNDQIPNYPEATDLMTRLNLISLLALVEDPRALPALKTFLQRKNWGISGVAAATLIQEGDDSSLEIVKELINDSDPNIHMQACLVLAMFGRDESVQRELQGAYSGADHEKKLHILEAIGKIGNQDSYSFLVSVLREPFPILRLAAAAALIQSINR